MNRNSDRRAKTFAVVVAALLFALPSSAQGAAKATDPAAAKLVRAFEDKLNLEGLDITNTFTLVQKKEGETDRVLRVQIFRRDAADSFTLLFQYPQSEQGKGYWRNKDDLYLYLPSTREFVYRNRKDDVGGSDVRTDLFGKTDTLGQYWATMAGGAKVASWDTDVLRLDAKKLDVSYPVQKWYLRKTDGLPVKVENFSAGETLLRTSYYVDYKMVAPNKYIFTKLLAVTPSRRARRPI